MRLYFVDDIVQDRDHQVQGYDNGKLKIVQLWHRRHGHAFYGYLRKLILSLFSNISYSSL